MADEIVSTKNCTDRDVLSVISTLLKVGQLKEAVKKVLSEFPWGESLSQTLSLPSANHQEIAALMAGDGIDCEMLKPGKGLQKGKLKVHLKVTLEFCPDDAD